MSELFLMQVASVIQSLMVFYAFVMVGVSMWGANGKRRLLQLLAGKLAVNWYVSVAIALQTIFETSMVSHEPITWHFQWLLRVYLAVLAFFYIKFGEEIRPAFQWRRWKP